ncbi:hypothetical protein PCASD_18136 [Puccinia coronata f. sp. avenae]|uniref:Uncharacterized protein n=1 Tax=Puccinia coronata f. sp. avenae TaxID=200324 RepID=A0A2N5SVC6_9BASI|nr:hypothetical protein PCASD_18136 [Puccinia coronata f. sp. avenae]
MPAPSPLKQKSRRDASPDKDIDPSDNAWDNDDSASNSGSLHQADVLDDVDPLAVGELLNIPGTKPAHKISLRTTKPSGKTTKTSMPCKEGLLGSDSDVECVPPPEPDANIKRSPGRKYRRSRASGVDSALQRLHVNHDEGNQRARSVLPMRKRPGSKQSSAANPFSNNTLSSIASVSGGPESPKAAINTERTLPPLNEMGLALSMADFLRLVGFKDTNTALPVLMSFNHIEH